MSVTGAILAGVGAAGSLGSAVIGSNAAQTAAGQEVSADQQGINTIQSTESPYVSGGETSLAQLLAGLKSGQFGTPSTFTAPTLAQAQQYPGYEFTQNQGDQAILEGSAASGGSISGGTLKALDTYNTNLANTTYGSEFNQALSTYNANLQGNQQAYQQLFAPTQLGANAATSSSQSIAQLLASLGESRAAGTVGSANAINSGIAGGTNSITQALLLSALGGGTGSNPGVSMSDDEYNDYVGGGTGLVTAPAGTAGTSSANFTSPGTSVASLFGNNGTLLGNTSDPLSYGIGPG